MCQPLTTPPCLRFRARQAPLRHQVPRGRRIRNVPLPLVIVGAGGFGREVAFAAESRPEGWAVSGFLDDRADVGRTIEGWRLLGRIDEASPGVSCVVAVGNPRVRRTLAERASERGVAFATVDLDPSRHRSVLIAEGGMLMAGVRTTVNTQIGRHFIGNLNCTIGHDVRIGSFVTIAPLVAISGNVQIGDGAEIGTGACLREGIRIGEGAMVGMGAVVVRDVEANSVVVGNPARMIKQLAPW